MYLNVTQKVLGELLQSLFRAYVNFGDCIPKQNLFHNGRNNLVPPSQLDS